MNTHEHNERLKQLSTEEALEYLARLSPQELQELADLEDELLDAFGNYCVVNTGTSEGRILVQIDGHGRIYNLE